MEYNIVNMIFDFLKNKDMTSKSETHPGNIRKNPTGLLYFYVHFVTEVLSFYGLYSYLGNGPKLWIIFILYDMLAFVPQAIIGYISDKRRGIPFGLIGLALLALALPVQKLVQVPYYSLVLLCLGNACTHVSGAEATLRSACGKLSQSAVFVAGGSFGVITGQLLCRAGLPFWPLMILAATAVPFVLYAQSFVEGGDDGSGRACTDFRYDNADIASVVIVFCAVFIIIVRGYMAYGIPTAWKKTVWQNVLLFVFMGCGKALGGILADRFGVKKVAVSSALLALPFLMLGDRLIIVSLTGVMLFSMTMSITLALLVSVLPHHPGLAFGLTTIGLFLGTAPVFFFRFTGFAENCIMLAVLTAASIVCMMIALKGDKKDA